MHTVARPIRMTVAALAILAAACERKEEPAGPAVSPEARAEAQTIFTQRCTTCHGPNGAGDGPASAGLSPPPRNFQEPSWQSSVTDEHIFRIIKYGGAAVGKSPGMPANPDLEAKDEVVNALVAHVRSLGRR